MLQDADNVEAEQALIPVPLFICTKKMEEIIRKPHNNLRACTGGTGPARTSLRKRPSPASFPADTRASASAPRLYRFGEISCAPPFPAGGGKASKNKTSGIKAIPDVSILLFIYPGAWAAPAFCQSKALVSQPERPNALPQANCLP